MSDLDSRLAAAMYDETATVSARPTLAEDVMNRGARLRRRRRVAGGAAGLAVLVAVVPIWRSIDTSASRIEPANPSTSPATPTHPKPTHSALLLPAFSTRDMDVVHQRSPTPHVVGLRTGRHATYDRVVVDLTGAVPGYHVGYVRSLVGPSGKTLPLPGKAFIAVRLTPATAHTVSGTPLLLQGATTQLYDLPTLRGSALTEDFEGYVSFGLALSRHAPFRVFELSGPSRLVIDVRH